MTIINILGDGTTYPSLRKQDLIIKIQEGKILLGQFDRCRFLASHDDYLKEPLNAADLKADTLAYINAEMPGLFGKRNPVYIICPVMISSKAIWTPDSLSNSTEFNRNIFSETKR